MNNDYLNDIEKQKVTAFVSDEIMMNAIKKVFLYGIYQNGTLKPGEKPEPLKNFALSLAFDPKYTNEELGADLRASAHGISFVEKGFNQLVEISNTAIKSPLNSEDVNPAE